MAHNSLIPKRHWFLHVYRDRKQNNFYCYDSFLHKRVSATFPTLALANEELQRIKHSSDYRQEATFERGVPWAVAGGAR